MRIRYKRGAAVAAVAVVLAASAVSAQAATTSHDVRASDFTASHQDPGATYSFLKEGLHVNTANTSDYAKAYFAVGQALADVTSVDYDWYGTENRPSVEYNVDLDGDGKYDGQLIGEAAYGGQDVWLNRDTQDGDSLAGANKGTNLPADTFADAAPCNSAGSQNGSGHTCGSTGNPDAHGTLADWASTLDDAGFPNAQIVTGGFLANGSVMDGVLRAVAYGSDSYVFTDLPVATSGGAVQTTNAVTAKAPVTSSSFNRQFIATLGTNACPASDTCKGTKVTWKITVDGGTRYQSTAGWGESTYFRQVFSKAGGNRTVKIYRNGTLVATKSITTK
jgi:hypothetical protein